MVEEAQASIANFFSQRDQTKEKTKKINRSNEDKFVAERDSVLSGTNSKNEWVRVATLVDFKSTAVGKDTSRMRKVLIDLKQ